MATFHKYPQLAGSRPLGQAVARFGSPALPPCARYYGATVKELCVEMGCESPEHMQGGRKIGSSGGWRIA